MEPCDCSNSLCISKKEDRLRQLRKIIRNILKRYIIIHKNAPIFMEVSNKILAGAKDEKFMNLKRRWLQAKYIVEVNRAYVFRYLWYIENCKTAQSVLNSNKKEEKYITLYFGAKIHFSKIFDDIKSLGYETIELMVKQSVANINLLKK